MLQLFINIYYVSDCKIVDFSTTTSSPKREICSLLRLMNGYTKYDFFSATSFPMGCLKVNMRELEVAWWESMLGNTFLNILMHMD